MVDSNQAPIKVTFSVETLGGIVNCNVGFTSITVDMGLASFKPADLPVITDNKTTDELVLNVEGTSLVGTGVSLGNPHVVIFVDDELDSVDWRKWGAAIEDGIRNLSGWIYSV